VVSKIFRPPATEGCGLNPAARELRLMAWTGSRNRVRSTGRVPAIRPETEHSGETMVPYRSDASLAGGTAGKGPCPAVFSHSRGGRRGAWVEFTQGADSRETDRYNVTIASGANDPEQRHLKSPHPKLGIDLTLGDGLLP